MGAPWPKAFPPYLRATHYPQNHTCPRCVSYDRPNLSIRRSGGTSASPQHFVVLTGHFQVLCFGVPELRRYWACLLQDCIEKYAQEHPLYALFSSVLSTLSKITSAADLGASPTSTDGSILFSYPQCRVVDKEAVGDSEFASMSAYPDFGLMHLKTKRSANGETKVEQVRLLIEIKRLYRYDEGE